MNKFSLVCANSLFSLAYEEGKADSVLEELLSLKEIFKENGDFAALLDTPSVALEERLSLIDDVFRGADVYVINFLKVLCEKKCVSTVYECISQYEKAYDKANNILRAAVITAVPLSEEQKNGVEKKLSGGSEKKVICEYKVDKSILGGIIIRTENSQTDASLRTRLDNLKVYLASAASID